MNFSLSPFLPRALRIGAAKAANRSVGKIKIVLGTALLAALVGCVGYVDGGYGGGVVVAPGPDVFLFGGGYDRGRDVHAYSHRGGESRAAAHPAGGGRRR